MNKFIHFRLPFILVSLLLLWPPQFCRAADIDSAEAVFTPWSGYWWPTNKGGLATGLGYDGHPAPLEKYDLLTTGSYPGPASQWYLEHDYDPDAPTWYGLCGAWASASVFENITFYPSVIDKILFKVGDKKGLITATHDYDIATRVNSHDPEVFHAWLLQYIKGEGISFYAELDPGEQVWNYPVYKYEMTTIDSGDSLAVTCQIWYADDLVEPDYVGTQSRTKIYTYTLYKDNSDNIIGGDWTGASGYDHPQQLVLPITPHFDNPYLDYNLIRSLAQDRDDELESEQTVTLDPGGYKLLLLNEDSYRLPCDSGDEMLLHISKDGDFSQQVNVIIRDGNNQVAYEAVLTGELAISLTADNPPYRLVVSSEEYSEDVVYDLAFDLKKRFEFANAKLQKGFKWGGFAITNASEATCETVYVVGYGKDGRPLDTYVGPFSLAAGEKRTVLTDDFEVLQIDAEDLDGVKILASAELQVVNLYGYFGKNMSIYVPTEGSSRFVIGDTSSSWDYSRSVYWGLYNHGVGDHYASLELFSPAGELIDSTMATLPANRAVDYSANVSPFADEESKAWVLVEAEDGSSLRGYMEIIEDGIDKTEAMSPLKIGTSFVMPHVIVGSPFWEQKLTLINVSGSANTVNLALVNNVTEGTGTLVLNPHEKRTLSLSSVFPGKEEAVLNRSGLLIDADQDMAGYVVFDTPGDFLYYPLLTDSDSKEEIVVPHVAQNFYWWTGCTLFNFSTGSLELQIIPYDYEGQVMTSLIREMSLAGRSKHVTTFAGLFGADNAAVISFVKIRSLSGPGISGLFAYGNRTCSMLSGAAMQ